MFFGHEKTFQVSKKAKSEQTNQWQSTYLNVLTCKKATQLTISNEKKKRRWNIIEEAMKIKFSLIKGIFAMETSMYTKRNYHRWNFQCAPTFQLSSFKVITLNFFNYILCTNMIVTDKTRMKLHLFLKKCPKLLFLSLSS